MDIHTERINRIAVPRRALAKRTAIVWIFEIIACTCGVGILGIVSVFCVLEGFLLTRKFQTVWRLYYHPATLYIVLGMLWIPAVIIGVALRVLIPWLILELPVLIF